jgi:hypothetical protein
MEMEPFSTLINAFAQEVKTAYSLLEPSLAEADFDLQRMVQEENWPSILHKLKMFNEGNLFSDALKVHLAQAEEMQRQYEQLRWKITLAEMSERELQIIGECLSAAANGPFFSDREFSTLFGLERRKVAEIASTWPAVNSLDVATGHVDQAINNTFIWLFWYPHELMKRWAEYVSATPRESYDLYQHWRKLTGRKNNQEAGKAEFFYDLQ